jgi:phosphotransferase system  glucose/maltose/N-acetylglucosamine-specific IIC component
MLFPRIEEPAAWFVAGGMSLMLVGAMSRLQLHQPHERVIATLSAVAAAIAALFWIALAVGLPYKFKRHPAAYGAVAIITSHAVIALTSRLRQRS